MTTGDPYDESAFTAPCPRCGGDGGWHGAPSRWSLDPEGPWETCGACDGTGEQPTEPVTLEDVEQAAEEERA